MSKVIAISGASHSGKTTLINRMCRQRSQRFKPLSEIIRSKVDNIDEVRRDPGAYLELQWQIINEKIDQEDRARAREDDSIYLADRSLADSLFYYTFYVDKGTLSTKHRSEYFKFLNKLVKMLKNERRYTEVLLLEPISPMEVDAMRPSDLVESQAAEFCMIRSLNETFFRSYLTSCTANDAIRQIEWHLQ